MTYSADKTILIWNDEPRVISKLDSHHDWVWDCCEIQTSRIASVSEDGQLKIWDLATGECLQSIQMHIPLRCIAYQARSNTLVCGDLKGNLHFLSDSDLGFVLTRMEKLHTAALHSIKFINPALCISCGEDKQIIINNISSHQFNVVRSHMNFVSDLLPINGTTFLSCSYDGSIQCHKLNDVITQK